MSSTAIAYVGDASGTFIFYKAKVGIRDLTVTGVQTCALPISMIQNNQPPDVLNLNSFSSYAKDGLLYAADEVLSPRTKDDFIGAFARGGEYRGTLYGFPILSSA